MCALCVCVCVCVCVSACVYVFVCGCVFVMCWEYQWAYTHNMHIILICLLQNMKPRFVDMCVTSVCVSACVCLCVYLCVCMCVYMYVFVYVHVYIPVICNWPYSNKTITVTHWDVCWAVSVHLWCEYCIIAHIPLWRCAISEMLQMICDTHMHIHHTSYIIHHTQTHTDNATRASCTYTYTYTYTYTHT